MREQVLHIAHRTSCAAVECTTEDRRSSTTYYVLRTMDHVLVIQYCLSSTSITVQYETWTLYTRRMTWHTDIRLYCARLRPPAMRHATCDSKQGTFSRPSIASSDFETAPKAHHHHQSHSSHHTPVSLGVLVLYTIHLYISGIASWIQSEPLKTAKAQHFASDSKLPLLI